MEDMMGKFVEGETVTGWGVVRSNPWHFVGIFPTKEVAEAKVAEMGDGYGVKWGDNRKGTDDFLWNSEQPDDA
jgi:hypothetical protein